MIGINNNQTIELGAPPNSNFIAFGDDSQYKNTLVFAYVVIHKSKIDKVLKGLERIKKKFRFPPNSQIHCRVLFSGQQREKANLTHLKQQDLRAIMFHIVMLINEQAVFVKYGYTSASEAKKSFGESCYLEMQDLSGNKSEMASSYDPKAVLGMLAQSCWAEHDPSKGPIASDCEIYAAADATQVKFLGDKRTRADRWTSGYSDIGAPSGAVFKIKPIIQTSEFSPGFELADIFAYICSHALEGSPDTSLFQELKREIKYWSSSELLPE
jgi:hypothetical protein